MPRAMSLRGQRQADGGLHDGDDVPGPFKAGRRKSAIVLSLDDDDDDDAGLTAVGRGRRKSHSPEGARSECDPFTHTPFPTLALSRTPLFFAAGAGVDDERTVAHALAGGGG